MLKKLLLPAAALLMVLGLAAPASAATDAANCVYDSADVPAASGSVTVQPYGDGRWEVTAIVNDSLANRGWDWQLYHNGDQSFNGTGTGDFTRVREMVDITGTDTIRFQFKNNARTVTCNASVTVF